MLMGIVDVEGNRIRSVSDYPGSDLFGSEPKASTEEIESWLQKYGEAEITTCPVRFESEHRFPAGIRWLWVVVRFIGRNTEGHSQFSYVAQDVTEARRRSESEKSRACIIRTTTRDGLRFGRRA